jgi:GntP family gluconate:H+ symporter
VTRGDVRLVCWADTFRTWSMLETVVSVAVLAMVGGLSYIV